MRVSFFEKLDFYEECVIDGRYFVYRSILWCRTIVIFDQIVGEYVLTKDSYKGDNPKEYNFDSIEEMIDANNKGIFLLE